MDSYSSMPAAPIGLREDGRLPDQLRPLRLTPGIAPHAHGSVLIATGETQVICAVTIESSVPKWMKEQGVSGGWITAEYSMLPYSTTTRKARDSSRGKPDGRGIEIQRLIGRALRTTVDLEALGERTLWIDCDVLQADGGTRTAAITGACVALVLACEQLRSEGQLEKWPLRCLVGAVSVGICNGIPLLDLNYREDRDATVDLNLVMTSSGQFVEVQGAGEEATFSEQELSEMLTLGRAGIEELIRQQRRLITEICPQTLIDC
jgi:ribonuclease PH